MVDGAVGVRPVLNRALAPFGTTIFTEMSQLAAEHGAVNLGQGFPDFAGPQFIKEAASQAIADDHNQYAPMAGVPALQRAIANKVQQLYGLGFDPGSEVTIYSGCTEAIHCALLALCEPGDEVVLLEPYYDSYAASVAMAGATPRFVTLQPPDFRWDRAQLDQVFNDRTRLLLLNTPHNPTGRVFDRQELAQVAHFAQQYDVYVVSDEVYEHLVFEGQHLSFASLPGMRERTITLNSTGKTFSLTGWKIGYSTAPAELTAALRTVHQFVTFATATPLQHAMVRALQAPQSYFEQFVAMYRRKRDYLATALTQAGFDVFACQGTYFICAGFEGFGFEDDVQFCKHLIETAGVVAIPPSAFFHNKERAGGYVRFAFCKTDEVLAEAARRLAKLT